MGASKFRILSLCSEPTSFSDIVRRSGISKTNASIHINDLERGGYIIKDQGDGLYRLTSKGKEYCTIRTAYNKLLESFNKKWAGTSLGITDIPITNR